MNPTAFNPSIAFICASAVAAIAAVLWATGALRSRALSDCPVRELDLTPLDFLVAFFLMFVFGGGLLRLVMPALGLNPDEDLDLRSLPSLQAASFVLLSQLVTQLPAVIYIAVRAGRQENGLTYFGLRRPRGPKHVGAALIALVLVIPLVFAAIRLTVEIGEAFGQPVPDSGHEMLSAMQGSDTAAATAMMILSAVLVAPVLEEIIYRGLVQTVLVGLLGRSNRWPPVLLTSVLFALIHTGSVAWQTLPALFLLALVLGWLYERTGSLVPSILVHVGFNGVNTVLALKQNVF